MNGAPTIPELLPGTVLELRKDDWRYGAHPLSLRVEQVRHDLSRYYDRQWVWIVGESLDPAGLSRGRVEALVKVAALTAAR